MKSILYPFLFGLAFQSWSAPRMEWEWANPKPSGNNLIHVAFDSPERGLIVADNGEVSETTDGGTHWKSQQGRIPADYLIAATSVNPNTLLAVSGFGKIWRSVNRGKSWDTVYSTSKSLIQIQSCGDDVALAIALDGTTIVRSGDKGATWKEILHSPEEPFLVGVNCNPRFAHAVGDSGTIWYSRNRGLNWAKQNRVLPQLLTDVYFSDSTHGMVTTSQGRVAETRDGGKTWKVRTIDSLVFLGAIQFQRHRWRLTGSNGSIWTSRDDGLNWSSSDPVTPLYLTSADFLGDSSGIAIGENGLILKEGREGSWKPIRDGSDLFLDGMTKVTPTSWIAFGSPGHLLNTNNAGQSWTSLPIEPDTSRFVAGDFSGAKGILSSMDGVILVSGDSGNHWKESPTPFKGYRFFGAAWAHPQSAFVVGDSGLILRTEDQGRTWNRMPSPTGLTTETLSAVGFQPNGSGLIVGYQGLILRSEDSGSTWMRIPSTTSENLYGFSFRDAMTGIAVGSNGIALTTRDGGLTWAESRIGTPGDYVFAVAWLGGDTALVSGDWGHGGFLSLTTNAGGSWVEIPLPTRKALWAMKEVGPGQAVIMGEDGAILFGRLAHERNPSWEAIPPLPFEYQFQVRRQGHPGWIQVRLDIPQDQAVELSQFSLSGKNQGSIYRGQLKAGHHDLKIPMSGYGPRLIRMSGESKGGRTSITRLLRF